MGYGNGGAFGEATQAGYAPAVSNSPREPMIARETLRLEKLVDALHQGISELDARLSPVLMPESPQGIGKDNAPMPSVPMAQALASMADRVAQACQRLQSLNSRVEL
jgi:hypothetical protein